MRKRSTAARFAALILWVAAVTAAGACGSGEALETRTFDLEHLRPAVAEQIVAPYVFTDRAQDPGMMSVSADAGAITVRERPENLEQIARVLKARDVPRPGLRLHFQVIEAGAEPGGTDPALTDLEPALRQVLRFDSYRLVAEAVVRTAEESEFRQSLSGDAAGMIEGVVFSTRPADGGPATARLRVEYTGGGGAGLATTVNVTDGRTVVLGTAGRYSGGEGAVILVVRPEFES